MTTYTFSGFTIFEEGEFNSTENPTVTDVAPVEISIVVEDGDSVFTYENIFDEFTGNRIGSELSGVTPYDYHLGGTTFTQGELLQLEVDIFNVSWGAGNNTQIIAFGVFQQTSSTTYEFEYHNFIVGGDEFTVGSLAEFEALNALVTSFGPVTAPGLTPGDEIDIGTLAGVTISENDYIVGDGANNTLNGGLGNDEIEGKGGDDTVSGGQGKDTLKGHDGEDTLRGDGGADKLFGGNGNDTVLGGTGNDRLLGGSGNDTVEGGSGRDVIKGESGNDKLKGHNSDDKLYGGNGDDVMFGGNGNDVLSGGRGEDRMFGGSQADYFEFRAGHDTATIADFENNLDTIRIDEDLVDTSLTRQEFLAEYGSIVDGNAVLTFGGGDMIIVEGVTNINLLGNDIEFI